MRKCLVLCVGLLGLFSCNHDRLDLMEDECPAEEVGHEMIVLGEQLEDPYSVKNITRAMEKLYPVRSSRHDVTPTDIYVRFLPKNETEYNELLEAGIQMMDHPLDYQIIREGDYYHDPELDSGQITWQYAVLEKDFKLPEHIRHEVLDDCFIPEHDAGTRSDGLDWDNIVSESYRLTGNEELLEPDTRSERSRPHGRITIVDDSYAGGKPLGVSGVKVVCNSFVKFSSCYTDRDGEYEIPKEFGAKVRYRLMFKNDKGFSIGLNLILVPASFSALGKGSPEGIDVNITSSSERKLFCRSVVNNAMYDYLDRCQSADLNLVKPPMGIRIWIMQKMSQSSTVMMHQGAVIDSPLLDRFFGEYKKILKVFLPDITIGAEAKTSYAELYSDVLHECAHASHFTKAGTDFWNAYVFYIMKSWVTTGNAYGNGEGPESGFCEIGEMWAYFMERILCYDRYGISNDKGDYFWFHPQIFFFLFERGFSVSDLFEAFDSEICSLGLLRNRLLDLYPDREILINQAFNAYLE